MLACVSCAIPLRILKTGAIIESQDSESRPVAIFHGDIYECRLCGTETVRTADQPWTESFKPDYAEEAAKADCVVRG